MMVLARLRHALEHEALIPRDVHLDATGYAQAPWTGRGFVGTSQRSLQLRIGCTHHAPVDGKPLLLVH
jgi:hypothetical protein